MNIDSYNKSVKLIYYYHNNATNLFENCNETCKYCDNPTNCTLCNYTIYGESKNNCYTLDCKVNYTRKSDNSDRICYPTSFKMDYYYFNGKYFENCHINCKTCKNNVKRKVFM